MNLQRTQILSGPTGNINGTEMRPLLAGDSAYSQTLPGQRTPDSGAEKV